MKTHTVPVDMGSDLPILALGDCKHETLHFDLDVARVAHNEGEGPHTLMLAIGVLCAACGERMRFRGAKHAISFRRPAGDIFGWTLSAPMEPTGDFDLKRLDEIRESKP